MDYLHEMFSLRGKTAVITGGGGVLAGSISEALLKAGANISLWGRGHESLDIAYDNLINVGGTGERLQTVVVDTGDEEALKNAVKVTEKKFGSFEVLVNGVGGNRGKSSFIETDIEQFESVLKLNLIAGLMAPTKVIAANWIEKKIKGTIINLASMASYIPLSGVWAYGAAKSGVMNLTMAAAREFAPFGIRVNAIAPGFFLGKQNKALLIDETSAQLTPRGKAVIDHTPFGRFGDASEIAGCVLFLASDKASGFVTGITVPVDGGYLVSNI
ncbi:MAG: SDR family oxidoreductase [Spirochaetota bacterium]